MECADCLAYEVDRPDIEQSGRTSTYFRICALSKILHGHLQSGAMNQCVTDVSFAICLIDRVARAQAGGIYARRKTACGEIDRTNPITHAMKYERVRNMDCVSGFFFHRQDKDSARDGAKYS